MKLLRGLSTVQTKLGTSSRRRADRRGDHLGYGVREAKRKRCFQEETAVFMSALSREHKEGKELSDWASQRSW